MKSLRRAADATLGRWTRHLFFVLLRSYYGLFFNISCADKAALQDLPGGLILCSHGSRHDGPVICALLYTTRRVRPAVLYTEYYNPLQWFPLMIAGSVPMSSPKTWPTERRKAQKEKALHTMRRIIENGNMVLLYPAGMIKKQRREIIAPHFSGAYETIKALDGLPVALIRIRGLSPHEETKRDRFWTFIGRKTGRRHVLIDIEIPETPFDTAQPLADFNAEIEARFNLGLPEDTSAEAPVEAPPLSGGRPGA
ncbi:MAG: 1-acyl-sn-glycerol-3-phosphate acyltransferase [Pseudomonadota bacterium]